MMLNTTCAWMLARVYITVVVSPDALPFSWEDERALEDSYLRPFYQRSVNYDGDPEECWDSACGSKAASAPCRLEAAFGCAFARATRAVISGEVVPRWFVFTDSETWWHDEGLANELFRAEALLRPATPENDVLLHGGGGLLTFGNFMIVSLAGMRRLAHPQFLPACRERLLACDPDERGAGCKFKKHAAPGEAYMANQLVHYCLQDDLATCARPGGCGWLFGAPSPADRDAAAARRRYVSNDARKPVKAALPHLHGLPTSLEDADACGVYDAMADLVAFANGGPDAMPYLKDLRNLARKCAVKRGHKSYACDTLPYRQEMAAKLMATIPGPPRSKRKRRRRQANDDLRMRL